MLKLISKLFKRNKKYTESVYHELQCPKCMNRKLSMSPYDDDTMYPINIEKHLYHCNVCGTAFYYHGGESDE